MATGWQVSLVTVNRRSLKFYHRVRRIAGGPCRAAQPFLRSTRMYATRDLVQPFFSLSGETTDNARNNSLPFRFFFFFFFFLNLSSNGRVYFNPLLFMYFMIFHEIVLKRFIVGVRHLGSFCPELFNLPNGSRKLS